jgi:3-phytase
MIAGAMMVAGCASSAPYSRGEPPVFVSAVAETVVTTDPAVDADDPALWADMRDPSRALLFGTDKSDGLYVHNVDGSVRQFLPSGALNNVDLRPGFNVADREMVLVAASSDERFGLFLYLLDPVTLETTDWGFIPTQTWEPYGFCMGRRGDDFYLIANSKTGEIRIWSIEVDLAGAPVSRLVRELRVGSQPEGCVVDDDADVLYVGEEDVALWRFDFDPSASATPEKIAAVDGQRITADVEGVTIMRDRGRKYLIASSQGDNTFPVYRIEGDAHVYLGRFTVIANETIDAVTQTDGVDAWSGPIGTFPEGLVAMHDHSDAPPRGQQNYKLVDWREIRRALAID